MIELLILCGLAIVGIFIIGVFMLHILLGLILLPLKLGLLALKGLFFFIFASPVAIVIICVLSVLATVFGLVCAAIF